MKYLLLSLLSLGLSFPTATAQVHNFQIAPPYFQQEVNYRIDCALNDVNNTLTGNIDFEYINHSPDSLPEIWIHLWANAYKNRNTAFCKQKLRDGNGKFYFAKEEDLGGYKKLDFTVDGQKITWTYDLKNPDIAVLHLAKPLAPEESIHIATPFLLKIPASFSRLGHVETSYQMTQWYPKPAVYDMLGWHAMPYLDIGEFYSEFGSFDVTLTLPENYVVGATGVLQTPSEIEFLQKKERESRERLANMEHHVADTFPQSSLTMKTIRYTAEKVHDFAWFADKRFLVLKDTAHLASGKTVECWAMFPSTKETSLKTAQSQLWEKGAFYVRRAIEFYSDKVGEYPWPQATAVHSALSAGAGMEYPMVTVIGDASDAKDLDDVITHEVGHNWFYGILASNEREHPFMDEGINSYYESRYMKEYYGSYSPYELPKILFNEKKQGTLLENACLFLARNHKDTPPDTHANEFTEIAYGLQAYIKTALCMSWLEQSVGTEKLDAAMQEYYRRWQFRHPYPEDLKTVLKDMKLHPKWFMETMQTQKKADYVLQKAQKTREGNWALTIKNKGALMAPFPLTAFQNGKEIKTEWHHEFSTNEPLVAATSTRTITMDAPGADAFEIDYQRITLDLNRKNNFRRTSGILPGLRPLEYRPIALFENSRRNTLAILPWAGWNYVSKAMLGVVVYSAPLPGKKLQYYLIPAYTLGSKSFVGWADIHYKLYPGGLFPKLNFGLSAKTFMIDYNSVDDYYKRVCRIAPQIHATLNSPSQSFQHALNLRTMIIRREDDLRDQSGEFIGKTWRKNNIYELRYEGEQASLPHPYLFNVALETQQYHDAFDRPAQYLRGTAEWKQRFYYQEKRKVTMRLFAGYFIYNTQRHRSVEETSLSLNPQNFNDYKFDQIILIRPESDGFIGRQVAQTEGGFKGAFGSAFAGTVGNSNNFILAVNLRADLPVRLPFGIPLKPYLDLGYFDDATPTGIGRPLQEQLLWNGGLLLEFFKGRLEVYFPLASSATLKNLYCEQAGGTNRSAIFCGGDYRKIISWSIRVSNTDIAKLVENSLR